MKFTIKIALVISLFCSTAIVGLAEDGQMGSGTRTCQTNCLAAGQPTVDNKDTKIANEELNNFPDVYEFVKNFLFEIFG